MLAEPWSYCDIETSPRLGTFPDLNKVRPPKNYTVEASIREYKEKNAYRDWANEALDRARAQVIICGLALEEGTPDLIIHTDERVMFDGINAWWVRANRPSTWCAQNGMGFDFWILATRAAKHGFVDLARSIMPRNPRYPDDRHRDPYMALGQEGRLEDWAEFWTGYKRKVVVPWGWAQEQLKTMKRPSTDELQPFELIRLGRPDLAHGKCLEDVEMLRDHIVKPMRNAGLSP